MRKKLLFAALFAMLIAPLAVQAQLVVSTLGDARLIDEPSGNRGDNNGGNTISGALIGVNSSDVDNIIIHDFSNLITVAPGIDASTVTGATINIQVNEGFSAGNRGNADDTITLHEIALGNSGFDTGSGPSQGEITGGDTPATDGSTTFLLRSSFGDATDIPWVDAAGNAVGDLRGALTALDSTAGFFFADPTTAPATVLSFNVDAATAQGWLLNGLAGLAITSEDNGDGNGRFNLTPIVGTTPIATANTQIVFNVPPAVPEPTSAGLIALCGIGFAARRRRR